MKARLVLAAIVLGATGPARADDPAPLPLLATAPAPSAVAPTTGIVPATGLKAAASAPPLPSMALDPQAPESLYHGLYVGTEIFGITGGRGIKGGIGGDAYAGYARVLDNGMLLGLQGTTGYGPALFDRPGLKGFDFGEASATVGYPMGRLTPFVTGGLLVAKPITGPGLFNNTTDSFNDLLNGSGNLYAAPRVGAGFAYQLTNNTAVSFDVTVGRGLGAAFP